MAVWTRRASPSRAQMKRLPSPTHNCAFSANPKASRSGAWAWRSRVARTLTKRAPAQNSPRRSSSRQSVNRFNNEGTQQDLSMSTAQAPIPSGYGMRTEAREALGGRDLKGKVAIVTGGYSGLGLETTKALADAGATVIVPARTPEKARAALAGLRNVEQAALDLADPGAIDAFANDFLGSGRKLDILINNAAIMASPLMRDVRGYEAQFATNHLG